MPPTPASAFRSASSSTGPVRSRSTGSSGATPGTSILSVDSFRALDTTRIFALKSSRSFTVAITEAKEQLIAYSTCRDNHRRCARAFKNDLALALVVPLVANAVAGFALGTMQGDLRPAASDAVVGILESRAGQMESA